LPDLVFLDVKMPGLDGFGVLKKAASVCTPAVIFMTAYDRYAVRAFEANALDYLLKPIGRRRFDSALDRVRRRLFQERERDEMWNQILSLLNARTKSASASSSTQQGHVGDQATLAVRDRDLTLLLRLHEIDWIESADNYAVVHSGTRQFILRATIAELEARLAAAGFARVSRSVIVNKERIHGFKSLWHGDYQIYLRDGTTIRLSRRYKGDVLP
jgi:two-component system LytT family response regulator